MAMHTMYPDPLPNSSDDQEHSTPTLWNYPCYARDPTDEVYSCVTGELDLLPVPQAEALMDVSCNNGYSQFDSLAFTPSTLDSYQETSMLPFLASPSRDQEATNRASPWKANQHFGISSPCSTSSSTLPSSDTISSFTNLTDITLNISTSSNNNSPLQVVQYSPMKAQKRSKSKRIPRNKSLVKKASCALTERLDVLKMDTCPKTSVKLDENGDIAGTVAVFGLNQVVRAPVDNELRRATVITRRLGACFRCRRHRLRCDVSENIYEPCRQCLRRQTTQFKYQPCIRVNILDLHLHRKGPTISNDLNFWVQRKQQELVEYGGHSNTHVLFLTQGLGEGADNALSVKVSRFVPKEGDRTTYFWTDPSGQPRTMELPPYFISDIEAARQSIRELLYNVRSPYIETLLTDANPVVRETIQAALVWTAFGQDTLISDALDIWVAARFIENQWRVFCGGVNIGLNPPNEPGNPWNGITPITPIMDTQLDHLVICELLIPRTKQFLEKLKAKIDEMKRENWLEIFLSIFIVMSNFGLIIKDLIANATWKGLKPGSRGGTLTQGYMHACKTMLAYFHHACSGAVPFSLSFDELKDVETRDNGMTPDQIKYIKYIQEEIVSQKLKLSNWKDISMYDDENYWCYQMLSQDWKGDIPHAGEIDDFREEDLLSSSTI